MHHRKCTGNFVTISRISTPNPRSKCSLAPGVVVERTGCRPVVRAHRRHFFGTHDAHRHPVRPHELTDWWLRFCEQGNAPVATEGADTIVPGVMATVLNYHFPDDGDVDFPYHRHLPAPVERRPLYAVRFVWPATRSPTAAEWKFVGDFLRAHRTVRSLGLQTPPSREFMTGVNEWLTNHADGRIGFHHADKHAENDEMEWNAYGELTMAMLRQRDRARHTGRAWCVRWQPRCMPNGGTHVERIPPGLVAMVRSI